MKISSASKGSSCLMFKVVGAIHGTIIAPWYNEWSGVSLNILIRNVSGAYQNPVEHLRWSFK